MISIYLAADGLDPKQWTPTKYPCSMLAEATRISHIHGGVVLSMLFVLSLLRQVGGTRPNSTRSHVFPQNVQLATKNGILRLNLIGGVGLEDSIHPLRCSTPKRKSIANKMLKATK